jgi:DNA helicase-2/ATP-dependent DNA helicase PcrA
VLKASRFVEELPGEPLVYDRWQLEDGRGPLALVAPPPPAAMSLPALFAREPDSEGEAEGGEDVPF